MDPEYEYESRSDDEYDEDAPPVQSAAEATQQRRAEREERRAQRLQRRGALQAVRQRANKDKVVERARGGCYIEPTEQLIDKRKGTLPVIRIKQAPHRIDVTRALPFQLAEQSELDYWKRCHRCGEWERQERFHEHECPVNLRPDHQVRRPQRRAIVKRRDTPKIKPSQPREEPRRRRTRRAMMEDYQMEDSDDDDSASVPPRYDAVRLLLARGHKEHIREWVLRESGAPR